ncbi:site-specific integrase [Nonomuraea endophytica]|uniref:Integrase n=1 Tax=Nonomuraea endophytica TaxID=714136 RepID=A0A7W8ENC2_9ACTN|nr:site-specific integrase [Nonomuraea endophytica]MBB5085298.1 integrase [Nonomuraea endophytica]
MAQALEDFSATAAPFSALRRPLLVGANAERRRENVDHTKAVAKTKLERLLSRRDIPLRDKTLYRMLYETAARTSEILSLNVEDLDLDNRKAPLTSKGGDTEWIYWDAGTARLLPRLLRLPDGHPDGPTRTRGPLFLANRRPAPARRPGQRTSASTPDDPASATTGCASSWTLTSASTVSFAGNRPGFFSAIRPGCEYLQPEPVSGLSGYGGGARGAG